MPQTANNERNRFILLRYFQDIYCEGFFPTLEDAKKYAIKKFPDASISIYKLAGDCADLAD